MRPHQFEPSNSGDYCVFSEGPRTGACNRGAMATVHHERPSTIETTQGDAVIAFTAYAEAVRELVRVKDAAYGGAWQKQGYIGNLARILSKADRLKNICWQDESGTPEPAASTLDENVLDTLKDLMALAAFMAANIEDGNRWGR